VKIVETQQLHIRLRPATLAALRDRAASERRSMASMADAILTDALGTSEPVAQRLERAVQAAGKVS
jgi:hypothetical protein